MSKVTQPHPGVTILTVNTGVSSIYLSSFLSPSNSPATQHQITRNISELIMHLASTSSDFGPGQDCSLNLAKGDPLLIPILRAGLPMYVVAQTVFPHAETMLVTCTQTAGLVGDKAVTVDWMGRKPFAKESDFDGKEVFLMDTVVATGDRVITLLDEMLEVVKAGEQRGQGVVKRVVTVLTCYASPEGVNAIAVHPLVKGMVIGAMADSIDEKGFIVPSTGGDMGNKLFGVKA